MHNCYYIKYLCAKYQSEKLQKIKYLKNSMLNWKFVVQFMQRYWNEKYVIQLQLNAQLFRAPILVGGGSVINGAYTV